MRFPGIFTALAILGLGLAQPAPAETIWEKEARTPQGNPGGSNPPSGIPIQENILLDNRQPYQPQQQQPQPPQGNPHTFSAGEEQDPPARPDEKPEVEQPAIRYNPRENPEQQKLDDPDSVNYNSEENKEREAGADTPEGEVAPEVMLDENGNPIDPNAPIQPELPKWMETPTGSVKVLNKIYTRNKEVTLKKGVEAKEGSLHIKLEKCFRQPESDKKESSALLLISESFKSQPTKEIFHGWMFSASPAISALEHPIYDVILMGCEEEKKEPAKDTKTDEKPADKKDDKKDTKKDTVKDAKKDDKKKDVPAAPKN